MSKHYFSDEPEFRVRGDLGTDDVGGPAGRRARLRRSRRHGGSRENGLSADRKVRQLCRQVAVALDEALAECRDDVLRGLCVVSVEPFPDGSRLLVTVTSIDDRPGAAVMAGSVVDHLGRASGHLRSQVASAITRKRAPVLVYQLVEPAEVRRQVATGS
jgi:ribosome-binding factor A